MMNRRIKIAEGELTVRSVRQHFGCVGGKWQQLCLRHSNPLSNSRGRASVTLLDSVRVDYFGTPTPLSQVATLHVPDPGMITIQPWDGSMIAPIEKAIRSADLGLNPGNDGKLIRVPLPQLNEERRRELGKKIMSIAEDHRVALRNVRRDANESVKKLAKEKLISEDEDRRAHEEIQKMTDAQIAKLDVLAKAKEKELMEMK